MAHAFRKAVPAIVLASLALPLLASAPRADTEGLRLYRRTADFEDVKFDLTNAITQRGFAIDQNGKIGQMLERTGPAFGIAQPVYKTAEFVAFCSARLALAMTEADPSNVAFCPLSIVIYETRAKPGEIVVGFRLAPVAANPLSQKTFAETTTLLDEIAREATK